MSKSPSFLFPSPAENRSDEPAIGFRLVVKDEIGCMRRPKLVVVEDNLPQSELMTEAFKS
jgi:hypothetical protein